MNIGLIGAPGSGKSRLAEELAEELPRSVIIDNYIPEIEQETDLSITQICNYIGNLYVALGRYARERNARVREDVETVITCGTLIDTAVHSALDIVAQAGILNDEEKRDEAPKVQATLMMLSCLYTDTFHYDYVFYLPASYIDPPSAEASAFDESIQAALGGFKLVQAVVLAAPESRLETVRSTLGSNEVHSA